MRLSVIITTYNSEEWLQKVLVGYSVQTEQDFEVVIADDGSNEKTKKVIDSFKNVFKYPIIHVWQEDQGFQKCKILNKAIVKTNSDYLLFTDGDCIPRKDFVAQHLKHKEEGYFLSGGYFKLPMETSQKISLDSIRNQDCFSISWLLKNEIFKTFKLSKLTKIGLFASFMNWITPTKRTFNGHNTSCFKDDLFAINGFNEEMQYGGLDREVGERLFNYGIFSKQIRYSAVCLHLDHKRGYSSLETWKKNNEIREYNRKNKIIQIKKGINNYKMKASVIFSTYNAVEWLEKVIIGFDNQTERDFEIVIADDGSDEKTKAKIDSLRTQINIPIKHVWQEDEGFQKTKILNKAILASAADYLIFTDGDCIPRKDFVATHLKYREANCFLSGGYFKLSMATSKAITPENIKNQDCFSISWLLKNHMKFNLKFIKLLSSKLITSILNMVTPTTPSWNGHNASAYKSDLVKVNGFNNDMKYGGEDRELGERLINSGLKSKQIRYFAICVHLDHARGYVSEEVWKKNNEIRENTQKNKVTFTPNGISNVSYSE